MLLYLNVIVVNVSFTNCLSYNNLSYLLRAIIYTVLKGRSDSEFRLLFSFKNNRSQAEENRAIYQQDKNGRVQWFSVLHHESLKDVTTNDVRTFHIAPYMQPGHIFLGTSPSNKNLDKDSTRMKGKAIQQNTLCCN